MAKKTKACEGCEQEMEVASGLRESIWVSQLDKREIYLNSVVDDAVIEKVVIQIQNINDIDDQHEVINGYVREPIKLFIHTNGGDLYSALAVCSAIETSKTPVHTIAMGKAFSAGFLILMCGHKRYAQLYSTIMYHGGSTGVQGTFASIIEEADTLHRTNGRIHDLVMRHTDIPAALLEDVFHRKNDWYLDVEDALAYGVIDGVYGLQEQIEDEGGEPELTDEDYEAITAICDKCYEEDPDLDCSLCNLYS